MTLSLPPGWPPAVTAAQRAGHVALIGAGPGDPELLTLRAWRLLQSADVVLHDHLVSDAILALCPAEARKIDVGKIPHGKATAQQVIHALLIKEARAGAFVVRLKGGDPLVFGRGGEEALALAQQGIACQVVPGISSALAVPAAAGIPVTHRHVSTHFTVLTGMSARAEQDDLEGRWERAARAGGTLIFLMGVEALPRIVAAVRRAGLAAELPVAIVESGSRPEQRVLTSTLEHVVDVARRHAASSPAVIVIGEVVALREAMAMAGAFGGRDVSDEDVPDAGPTALLRCAAG